jgi:tellurite resistance protein
MQRQKGKVVGIFSKLFKREDKAPNFSGVQYHYSESVEDEDGLEYEEPDDPDFRMAGMRLGIVYRDDAGKITKRVIRLKRLDGDHYEGYLTAYCELRKDVRSFLTSRIQALYDPMNGEVFPSAEDFFGPYFDEREAERTLRYERSKFRNVWHIIEAMRDELQVLILVARVDGRFVKSEQEALLRYVRVRASDLGIPLGDKDLVVLRDWIRLQDPAEPDARIAIENLKNRPDGLQSLWEVSELIAEADGKYGPEERAAVLEIRSLIESIAGNVA